MCPDGYLPFFFSTLAHYPSLLKYLDREGKKEIENTLDNLRNGV